MDFNTLITHTFIKNLKCSLCENYLAYFPIHITTTNQNICGRCKIPEASTCVQNKVYEVIAEEVLFPCRYVSEGCVEKLIPKDVPSHENQCPLRLVKCPASEFSQCTDMICLPNIAQHCENKHSKLILKNGEFKINLSKSEKSSNIFIEGNSCFIFRRIFDSTINQLTCSVFCYDSGLNPFLTIIDFYDLCLNNDFRSVLIRGVINKTNLQTCSNDEVSLDVFKKEQDFIEIKAKLSIGQPDSTKNSNSDFAQELIKIFKCSVCSKYILPPFNMYICCEKNMCLSCSKNKYGVVQVKFDGFDKLAEQLIYPCENQKSGCDYTSQSLLLKEHHLYCPYKTKFCPVSESENCKWSGFRKDTVLHIEKNHKKLIAKSAEFAVHLPFWNEYTILKKNYIIKFSNYLFRLSVAAGNNRFCWTMQMIGEFQNKFQYELELFSVKKHNTKLLTVQTCRKLTKENLLFKDGTEYSYFQLDQFNQMISGVDGQLTFRIRIIK